MPYSLEKGLFEMTQNCLPTIPYFSHTFDEKIENSENFICKVSMYLDMIG